MSLYKEILEFGSYFNSIRKHEEFIVVDLKLPLDWEDKRILESRGGKIQLKVGTTHNDSKIVSFFNVFNDESCDILIDEIKAIIKWNKDVEEKNSLLSLKMIELKKMFEENNVDSLRQLNFNFKKNNIELNGEKTTEDLVGEGSIERPPGNLGT